MTSCWHIAFIILLMVSNLTIKLPGQTIVFSENAGTPGATTSVASYTGWQTSGTLTFSGTSDVRNTTASSGYTGASGGGNVFFSTGNAPYFVIAGIDTSGFQPGSIDLSFGAYKNTTASDLTELSVSFSTDGSNYTSLALPAQATGSGTTGWRLLSITGTAIPASGNLYLKWSSSSTGTQFRIDDIALTGTAVPEPSTTAALTGLVSLVAIGWHRRRKLARG